ncbi:hypothetical protein [Roseovarius gaetbuli]|uniref:hypothetical protein n=1 Tax=Roseovarius gaetbuli TaxID=1356575 RepID=UPI00111C2E73|nr:hypothetical protein [Roseovarius gaetbuli]
MRRGIAVVRQWVFPASKQIVPLVIGGLCLWAIAHRFDANSLSQIGSAILGLGPAQWIMAMLATGLSFWALGRYDVVVHRHLRTGCAPPMPPASAPPQLHLARLWAWAWSPARLCDGGFCRACP